MKLSLWTYEGPTHVGAMRIAASMEGVHFVLHAPQGDTYADLLFTMIERRRSRPPVSYTTFEARDLGQDTATLFRRTAADSIARFRPDVLLVGASCTGELIQDDPAGLSRGLDVPVVALDLPAWQRKENWGAAETFYRLVRACAQPRRAPRDGGPPRCNLLGPSALGFRNRDDVREITALLARLGVAVNVAAPLGATVADLARLGDADFNIVLYPEIADTAARWLEREFGQATIRVVPIGVSATREFVRAVAAAAGLDEAATAPILEEAGNLPWWSRSVDATYLTGKRAFVFGDATHAIAAARVAADELGFTVVGLGSYSREQARDVREAAARLGVEALVTDDSLEVEGRIAALEPDLVLGTQMERHVAKRLGIPCAVISAPFHVEDSPARHSPQMGFEGANVIFDTWVHPLMMGLEEHLLAMFRNDPEFAPEAGPSHLGGTAPPVAVPSAPEGVVWHGEAEQALKRVPVFVRGKARRNTEAYARERGIATIDVETLYAAKAHHAR